MAEIQEMKIADRGAVLRRALRDAIEWQKSLADAWREGTHERQEALDQVKRYEVLLVEAGGKVEDPFKGMKTIPVDEILRRKNEKS